MDGHNLLVDGGEGEDGGDIMDGLLSDHKKLCCPQHTFQHHDLKNCYKVATQCVIDDVQSYTLINSKVCQIGPTLLTIMFWEMKTIGHTPKI